MRSKLTAALSPAMVLLCHVLREIVYLKFYENFTYEEIAVIMDIGVKSTYKLLYKALDKLRRFGPSRPGIYLLLLFLCPVRYK